MFGDSSKNKKKEGKQAQKTSSQSQTGSEKSTVSKGKGKGEVKTILGNGTKVEGNITTNGSLRIEGEVDGLIKAEGDLFVGEEGNIKTEVEARKVVIAGTVQGNVLAHDKLEILPSGHLNGDIKTDTLKIEEGAVFIGSSETLKQSQSSSSSSKKKSSKSKKSKSGNNSSKSKNKSTSSKSSKKK